MKIRAHLAAFAVLALCGSAFADLAFVDNNNAAFGTTDGADTDTFTNATTHVLQTVSNSGAPNFVTASLLLDPNVNGGGFNIHTTIANTGGNDDWTLWIWGNVVGTVKLTSILITDAGGNTAQSPGSYLVDLTGISPGAGNFINYRLPAIPRTGVGAYVYTGGFDFNTMAQVDWTFSFAAAGNSIALDAISNPEPGTIALFALGAMGLGGFAMKRRSAKKLPIAKS